MRTNAVKLKRGRVNNSFPIISQQEILHRESIYYFIKQPRGPNDLNVSLLDPFENCCFLITMSLRLSIGQPGRVDCAAEIFAGLGN